MNPKAKTAIALVVPVLLTLGTFLFHEKMNLYVQAAALCLVAAIAVLNVFHVSAGTVDVITSLVTALQSQTVGAMPPAPMMARARRIAKLAPVAAVAVLVMFLPGCKDIPAANNPTNLIGPGFACAEEVVLDLLGASDPNAIASGCLQFGAIAASDVVGIASTLLKQHQPAPGSAASPLVLRLNKIAAWKPQ